MNPALADCGPRALETLDRVLEEKPGDDLHQRLAEAVRALVVVRDRLIGERRRGGDQDGRLERVNAILSVLHSAEFPQAGARWQRMKQARDALAALLDE